MRFASSIPFAAAGLLALLAPARADIYTVTTTADSGAGSLRWAIEQANTHPGADSVAFNLPGSGVRTIAVGTALPALAAMTSVLGTTQPGYTTVPLVRLDGQNLAGTGAGLRTAGASLTIQGLQIVRFEGPGVLVEHDHVTIRSSYIGTDGSAAMPNGGDGVACYDGTALVVGGSTAGRGNVISGNSFAGLLLAAGCDDAVVWGNRIGTDASGTVAIPNQWDGISTWAADGTLGGPGAGEPNLLSGNGAFGLRLQQSATGNVIQGNRIGTNADGTAALGNGGGGVTIDGNANVVGGALAGAGNVISGNQFQGVYVAAGATNSQLIGNRIGTNAVGTAALGNASIGLWIEGDASTVGGTSPGAGNLISGNGDAGLAIGSNAAFTVVRGNRIGTNHAGDTALPNAGGVWLYGASNTIGGTTAGAGNLISGNAYNGIGIAGAGAIDNEIIGNRIGTNAAGTAAVGNQGYGIRAVAGSGNLLRDNLVSGNGRGLSLELDAAGYTVQGNIIGLDATMTAKLANASSGIDLSTPGHTIGGTQPGNGNVIAGNAYYGIWIDGPAATGNAIAGNWIGTTPAAASTLGNTYSGISITGGVDNTIGGTESGAGNVIAHNGYLGIFVWSGSGNAILGNAIHHNGLLGIDLDPQGPDANDPGDWDDGANRRQNAPVVLAAVASGGDLEIDGTLSAHPATEYRIELFSNEDFDPTGVGEAEHYLGAVLVTTDADGQASFATTLPAAGNDAFVTATATAPTGDTSELSAAIAVGAPQAGQLQIWRDLLLAYEGTPGLAVTIVRSHGVLGTVSVDVATVDGTATAPDDYGAVATTLTFGPGETMKSVFVPVVSDPVAEPDETWRLQLTNPQGGATLGEDDVLGWIFNSNPDWPLYAVDDATVVEGDDGQRQLTFTVTLSPTNHDLPIDWWLSDGTAIAGEDYVDASGQLLFHPGETSKTITVDVLGDTADELDEVFYVHLYGLGSSVVWDGLGDGRILDDDGGSGVVPTRFVFGDGFESGDATAWSSIVGAP